MVGQIIITIESPTSPGPRFGPDVDAILGLGFAMRKRQIAGKCIQGKANGKRKGLHIVYRLAFVEVSKIRLKFDSLIL